VLFLDSDDVIAQDAIDAGVRCLEAHPDAALVFGRPEVVGLPANVRPPRVDNDFYRRLLEENFIWMPLILHRRCVLEEIGGFDPRFDPAEDYDLNLRITRRFPIAFCAAMHGAYRRHAGSLSNDSVRMFRATSAVLRAQRRHVRSDEALRDARRRGIENIRRAHGRSAVMETRRRIASREVGPALSGLGTLLKYDLRGFMSALFGGVRYAAAKLIWRTDRDRG
jgi:GT2 family glycosyltransferase